MRMLNMVNASPLRRTLSAAALALALTAGDAALAAGPPAMPPPTDPVFTAGPYVLRIGEKVAVTVLRHQELTREFTIGVDGNIRVPLLGTVPASGRTTDELAAELRTRLSATLDHQPEVTVDIAAYVPVFVIGHVAKPGEIPFAPGMSVMMAFAKAGGMPSLFQLPTNQAMQAAVAERELRLAQSDLNELLAHRARLDAALANSDIAVPQELLAMQHQPEVAELLRREATLLETDRNALREAKELMIRKREQLDGEIKALTDEGKALASQANLLAEELDSTKSLRDRGLTTQKRLFEIQQMHALLEANRHRQEASMLRAGGLQTDLDIRLQQLAAEWRREREKERLEVIADISRAGTRAAAARAQLGALRQMEEGTGAEIVPLEVVFRITRHKPEGTRMIVADGATPLLPADILEVVARGPADSGPGTAIGPSSPGPTALAVTGALH